MNQDLPQILLADEAYDWLDSSGQQSAWEALYQRCPWRFPTLGPEYFRLWFRHYAIEWQPLLIILTTHAGELRLLMPLAVRESLITGVGAHQAEYQGWLCGEDERAELLQAALTALDTRLPRHTLRLHYLAPGISEDTLHSVSESNPRAMTTRHSRPLMRLEEGFAEQALRKKSTRSKINRLRRRGALTFRRLTDIAEIENRLDAIVAMYDFRQGAANDSCPFVDDPNKKAFLLDWARQAASGELHISCLMLDEEIIGAHIGVKSNAACQLAILAYSPRYSHFSPGKIQVYETARLLAEEGVSVLDLTPGGDPWKERFANEHDHVLSLTLHADRRTARIVRLRSRLDSQARRLLSRIGISPRDIKRMLSSFRGPFQTPGADAKEEATGATSTYLLTRYPSSGDPVAEEVHLNALHDLTLYKRNEEGHSRQAFLREALRRIESGQNVYTLVLDDQLAACAWVDYDDSNVAIIHDIYSTDGVDPLNRLMGGVLTHLKELDLPAVRLCMDSNDDHSVNWMEELGFTPVDTSRFATSDIDHSREST